MVTEQKLALIELFDSRMAASDSASSFLQDWCGGRVHARKLEAHLIEPSPEQQKLLGLESGEALGYRVVNLVCGGTVLSRAENWYRCSLLTAEMHEQLEQTDIPFGLIVSPLSQKRKTLATKRLTSPFFSEHRALLVTGQGNPFCIVRESYSEALLDFNPRI
jgi:4-hydroxybenzoate synthetase (chorismate lyase)